MKAIVFFVVIVCGMLRVQAQTSQFNQKPSGEDWSGSPRLLVQTGNASDVELASTSVTASIVGVITDVNVRQVYVNHGSQPLEAVYVFPGSTRAAVYTMTMTVGNHIIRAVVREKEQARREYVAAKEQGRSASLLEMLKPNIFRMNVANVCSGDSIVIDMRYTEAIALSEGVYEFVYPAVVAPRYVGAVQNEVTSALSNANLPTEIPGTFTISVTLSTGVPLKSVESPSHTLDINGNNSSSNLRTSSSKGTITKIGISNKDSGKQNRDFILRYVLSGRSIESGLLLFKGEKENYFMLMAQPPRNVEIPSVLPREFVFIVDVSGSMMGYPLAIANRLMDSLFTALRPEDKFNIMTFSGGSSVLSDKSVLASPENIERGRTFLKNNSNSGGGTELLPALDRALKMPTEPKYSRSFVVITDGYVSIEREAFHLVRENLNKANVYAFGIGTSVNRYLMEGLARAGNAEPMIITNQSEAPAMADKFKKYIEAPVLTNIKVDFGKLDVYDVEPSAIADVTAQRPIILFGKWHGKATGTVKLTGMTADGALDIMVDIGASPTLPEHSALKYLWARNKISMIEDESNQYPKDDERKLITEIGLKYNLLTRYTSFVAIDSVTSVIAPKPVVITPKLTIDTTKNEVYNSAIKRFSNQETKGKYPNPQIAVGAVKANRIYDSVVTTQKLRNKPMSSGQNIDDVANQNTENSMKEKKPTRKLPEPSSKTVSQKEESINPADALSQYSPAADSIKVQSGFSEPLPQGGYSIRGGRSNETQVRVQGTDVGDQISGGTSSLGYSGGADMSDALMTMSKPRRFFVGIISTINTGWLGKYEPHGLDGNQLSELTREPKYTFSVGLRGEYILGNVRNSQSSITADVMFGRVRFNYSAKDSVFSTALERMAGNYNLSVNASALTLNLLYNQRVPGMRLLYVFGGISTNYVFNSEHSYSVSASKPIRTNASVSGTSDDGRTVNYTDSSTTEVNNLQFVAVGGLRYDFYLGSKSFLTAFTQFDYGLTGFVKGGNEKPLILTAGIALTFTF